LCQSRVGLQLSHMSQKCTICLNMGFPCEIGVEIIWQFGGHRAGKRTVVVRMRWGWLQRQWGTVWGWGQN